MGTWNEGLLDNDTALDGLGDLAQGIVDDLAALTDAKPGARAAGRLAAAVGVLLQLQAYDFSPESPNAAVIAAALAAHAPGIAKLPRPARALLERVAAGEGSALADRPAKLRASLARLLHTEGESGLGKREPALFEGPAAAAYAQEVARRCVELIEGDFEDDDTLSDLCREGLGIGALALLLVLEPCRLPRAKVERWRRKAAQGLATLEARPDDELPFHRRYYGNLDRLFAALLARSAPTAPPRRAGATRTPRAKAGRAK